MKRNILLFLAAFCCVAGCKDDSVGSTVNSSCTCPEGQVCSAGGDCYANAACAACTADENCVGGVCYAKDTACGACRPEQVCTNDTCYAANDPCAQCEGKVCVSGVCYEKSSPCAQCKPDEKCVGETCYAKGNPCFDCDPAQVCNKGTCYDANHPCAACTDDEVCATDHCEVPKDPCDACAPSDTCVDGTCIPCPNVVCKDECCEPGLICDAYSQKCDLNCGTEEEPKPTCNRQCCDEGLICNAVGRCDRVCEYGKSCGYEKKCCDQDEQCLKNRYCAPQCDAPRILCGEEQHEVCCKEGDVCLKGECHTDCGSDTTRCGADQNLCCNNETEICIFNKCLPKGSPCDIDDPNACKLWEFCDSASGTCVSQDENDAKCIYRPPIGKFSPKEKWHWNTQNVVSTPIVINLTDDNGDGLVNQKDIPEVVFVARDRNLIAVSGDDGHTVAASTQGYFNKNDDIAAADIDDDGEIEVLVPTSVREADTDKSGLYGMVVRKKEDGTYYWHQKYFLHTYSRDDESTKDRWFWSDLHPTIANLDGEGYPEIVITSGVVRVNAEGQFEVVCALEPVSMHPWYDYMNVIADLDQDGLSEIIGENSIFTFTPVSNEDNHCKTLSKSNETGWYYEAVADLMPNDNDPAWPGELVPEIVRVKSGVVSVWKVYKVENEDGSVTWKQRNKRNTTVPGNKGNGAPTVADFNGDGTRDIGLAGFSHYSVIDGKTGEIIWASRTQDESSQRTGSTVFDFEGDGISEVVYRDETTLRIYSGPGLGVDNDGDGYKDGNILWHTPNTSGTVIEYPIVVDVDNDGKTEIVIVSEGNAKYMGITVYSDTYNNWVRTRTIWNQHSYHVTNINDDGTVPKREEANWLNPRLNNYRANAQPDDMFNAPNLVAGALEIQQDCENDRHSLTATVKNEGSLSARDVWVSFYIRDYKLEDGTLVDIYLGSAQTTGAIAPSGSATVTFDWNRKGTLPDGREIEIKLPQPVSFTVDDAPASVAPIESLHNECHEDDNGSEATSVPKCIEIVA